MTRTFAQNDPIIKRVSNTFFIGMEVLYDDLLRGINSHLLQCERLPLLFVSKKWNAIVKEIPCVKSNDHGIKHCPSYHMSIDVASLNCLPLLKWLVNDLHYPLPRSISTRIGRGGYIDVSLNYRLNGYISDEYVQVVEWAMETRPKPIHLVDMIKSAAFHGHFEAIRFIHSKFPAQVETYWASLCCSSLNFGQQTWLQSLNGSETQHPKALIAACSNNQMENVKWLVETIGVPLSANSLSASISSGSVQLVDYVMDKLGSNRLDVLSSLKPLGETLSEKEMWKEFWDIHNKYQFPIHTICSKHAVEQNNQKELEALIRYFLFENNYIQSKLHQEWEQLCGPIIMQVKI